MRISTRFAARALTVAIAFPLITMLSGCGPSTETEDDGLLDGESPYANFRGGEVKGNKNFAELINKFPESRAKVPSWAAFWWPYTGNGIASGAHGNGSSPAGKYDAIHGRTTNAQSWEVKNHGAGVPKVQGWWGHCNGWCASSALLPEPRESVKVNGMEFSVADLKGLLSEAGMSVNADFFGNRVDPWTREYQKAWDDTVPAQYFLVLTNFMGQLQQTVLIDRFTGSEVWNQPLAGYRFKMPAKADYLGEDPAHPGIFKINVASTIWWYNDSGVPANVITPDFNFEDALWQGAEVIQHRDFNMELWLDGPVEFDANGKITKSGDVIVTRDGEFFAGGAWKMGNTVDGNPDYMWVPYSFVKPDPLDDYANPNIDIEWIKAHLLVPGGLDDPSLHTRPVDPAPSPRPSPSSSPSSSPTSTPAPFPTSLPTSFPTFTPRPTPTSVPRPTPRPTRPR